MSYNEVININPKDAAAYNNRGISKANLGQYENAIKDYDKAIEINPKYATAYNNRGSSKANLGQHGNAIQDYDKAIEINPKYATAYYNRGDSKHHLGQYEEMYEDCRSIIKYTKELPQKNKSIYKYIPINNHQLLSLINKEIYCSNYKKLNDPLECFFINNEESFFGYFLNKKNINPRILSLTHDRESKLMYSHYADSHKGICVEYEIELDNLENSDNISFGKVEYAQKEKITNLKDLYMLKNSEWTYELEYRVVRFDNEEFLPVKIRSVVFGYKCPLEHRKIITTLLKNTNVKYHEMKQKGNTNNIHLQPILEYEEFYLDNKNLFKLMLKNKFENIYYYFKGID
jgi:tetratricopeptide (TPR) repeat protein